MKTVAMVFGGILLLAGVSVFWPVANEPTVIENRIEIDLPVGEAWQRLRNFTLADNYVPSVVHAEIVSERRTGVGTIRRVDLENGRHAYETIREWREGEGFVLELHDASFFVPFEEFRFRYAIAPHDGITLFTGTTSYRLRFGLLGRLADALFLEENGRRGGAITVRGLKHFYETGEPVTDEIRASW